MDRWYENGRFQFIQKRGKKGGVNLVAHGLPEEVFVLVFQILSNDGVDYADLRPNVKCEILEIY